MATADERIAEQRAEQEARSTELMLEQSQLQDQINEKKKAYKKAVAEGNAEVAKGLREEIEGLAQKNKAYKEELKILGLIGSQLDDNIGVMDKEALLAFDIAGAKKKQAAIDKQILLLSQKMQKSTGEEKEKIKDLIKSLSARAELGKKVTEETTKAASEAQSLNKAFDLLLGNVGKTTKDLEDMKDKAEVFKTAMFSANGAAAAVVASFAVMIMYQVDMIKGSMKLSEELGVSYETAKGFKKAFDDAQFSLGFFIERGKELLRLDFTEFGENFANGLENYLMGIDLSGATKAIKDQFKTISFGDLDTTEKMAQAAQNMAEIAKISGTDVTTFASATKNFMMVSGQGFHQAQHSLMEIGKELEEIGVASGDFMADMANNAEDVAAYSKDSGKNIIKAAAAARKMGVEFKTLTSMAGSLLDFESSIEKEMQASLMIGRQLNYDKARQLALEGDLAGAARNVVDQIGGVSEFQKMNVLQRQSLAESIGVSVDEMSRMITGRKADKSKEEKLDDSIKDMDLSVTDNTKALQDLTQALKDSQLKKDAKSTAKDTLIGGGIIASLFGLNKVRKVMKARKLAKLDKVDKVDDAAKAAKKASNLPKGTKLNSAGRVIDEKTGKFVKTAKTATTEKVKQEVKEKVSKEVGSEVTEKIAKVMAKQGSKTGAGFLAKQIPVIGAIPSLIMAGFRAVQGDSVGAGMELASAGAELANLTGFGTGTGSAVSFGLDAAILARDVMRAKDIALKEMKEEEFQDLTEEQRKQVRMASLPGRDGQEKTTQEIIDNLKIMTDTNEQQMAEFLEVLQAIAGNTQQTATNVERVPGQLTNN